EDTLGIAPRAIQHRLAHQAVVENHVRSLQQLQGPQREQVRIAGAGSNQVDLAESPAGGARGGGELRGQDPAHQRPLRPPPRARAAAATLSLTVRSPVAATTATASAR